MRAFLILCLCAIGLSAFSQRAGNFFGVGIQREEDFFAANRKELNRFPYRKVGDKYCSLIPLFKWTELSMAQRDIAPRPMQSWVLISGKVQTGGIISGGILIGSDIYGTDSRMVKNHPATGLVDGSHIVCFAIKCDQPYKINDQTVPAFDFGIPYDPSKLATNKPVATK